MTRHHWLIDKLFALLPDTAHIAVDPGFFADNYLQFVPFAVQLEVLPVPTGGHRNAPPSNEDIARVAVAALLDPHRHDGRAYRPTGPSLLSGADMADAVGEALSRRVRHMDSPPWMSVRAVHVFAEQLGADMFYESAFRHFLPENALGTWKIGGPTTHVRDVAGVEPEDFLTIARRYVNACGHSAHRRQGAASDWAAHADRACAGAPPGPLRSTPAASSARPTPVFGRVGRMAKRAFRISRVNGLSVRRYQGPLGIGISEPTVGPTIVVLAGNAQQRSHAPIPLPSFTLTYSQQAVGGPAAMSRPPTARPPDQKDPT